MGSEAWVTRSVGGPVSFPLWERYSDYLMSEQMNAS